MKLPADWPEEPRLAGEIYTGEIDQISHDERIAALELKGLPLAEQRARGVRFEAARLMGRSRGPSVRGCGVVLLVGDVLAPGHLCA
jgi:hypothetical protein